LADSEGEGQWLESGGGKETAETVLYAPSLSDPLRRSLEGHPKGNFTDYCNFRFSLGGGISKENQGGEKRWKSGGIPLC